MNIINSLKLKIIKLFYSFLVILKIRKMIIFLKSCNDFDHKRNNLDKLKYIIRLFLINIYKIYIYVFN